MTNVGFAGKVLELTREMGALFTTHTDPEYTTDAISYQMVINIILIFLPYIAGFIT